jgi:hypothetical protein
MISVLSHSTPQVAGFFVTEGVNAWIQFGTFYQDWAKRGLTHIAVKAIPVSGKVGNAFARCIWQFILALAHPGFRSESSRGLEQFKTRSVDGRPRAARERLGLRLSSAAFYGDHLKLCQS